jgi:signal transduction histidine kinase
MTDTLATSSRASAQVRKGKASAQPSKGPTGLSARLLALTVAFVLVGEVLFFLPGISAFRKEWLAERVETAEIAALAREASPDLRIPDALADRLLASTDIKLIALVHDGQRRILLGEDEALSAKAPVETDLRTVGDIPAIGGAIGALFPPAPDRVLKIVDAPQFQVGESIEVLLPEAALTRDLRIYSARLVIVSLMVSVLAGVLMYLALQRMLVGPMQTLTRAIRRFAENPEDASAAVGMSERKDEIGAAQNALASMEKDIRAALRQKDRLAQLGGAVARIAHDLRNSLATAGLVSERLQSVEDSTVQRLAPRLERALERANSLAEDTLKFGRAGESDPDMQEVPLRAALEAALDDAVATFSAIDGSCEVSGDVNVLVDPEHLHRILVNLIRNAAQAIKASGKGKGSVRVRGRSGLNGLVLIDVADDGPGIPANALDELFVPFSSRGAVGGTGLGLAISQELARANGGGVRLARTGPDGTTFEVTLSAAN